MQEQNFDQACRFIDALVAALQRYGVSSSAMESLLARVARALHLRGEFLATPAQVQSILWDEEDRQRLHISVASAGNYDLTKLAQLSELIGEIESGSTTPGAGLDRIRAIDRGGPPYGPGVNAVAFALCGLGFGVILGLRWPDVVLGGALSFVSYGLSSLATRSQSLATALELVVGAVAAALAALVALVFPRSNALAVAVCASIYFVPGFGLTLGASELMSGNTLSGLIGFTRAVVTAGKLVIGALMGDAIVRGLAEVPPANVASGVPRIWTWLFVPVLVLGLAILFRVRRKDLVWPLLGGIVAWLGVVTGSGLGFWQGTFIGAFLLMSASRVFARSTGLPAAIILLPAVMVLVPGVATLRALYVGQTLGLVEGIRSMSDAVALIGAILGGVLLGDAVWSIRQTAISTISSMSSHGASGQQ